MKLLDAIKGAEQCEREGIGADQTMDEGTAYVKDGGDGRDIWPFVRESRRRLIRMEDRMAISIKLLLLILGAIVSSTVALFIFIIQNVMV